MISRARMAHYKEVAQMALNKLQSFVRRTFLKLIEDLENSGVTRDELRAILRDLYNALVPPEENIDSGQAMDADKTALKNSAED